MKTKKIYLMLAVFSAILFGQIMNAQSYKEETDLFQSMFGIQKKEIVANFLQLESNNAFWPLYDEYETKRKELGLERLEALSDYAVNYDKMDNMGYDATIKKMIKMRDQNDKLIDSYYKKIKKASGAKVAGQFFQIEAYIQSAIRTTILQEIPFIGELETN